MILLIYVSFYFYGLICLRNLIFLLFILRYVATFDQGFLQKNLNFEIKQVFLLDRSALVSLKVRENSPYDKIFYKLLIFYLK